MPSTLSYTPFETLSFFQSVARHGTAESAFEGISAALNANELIREDAHYDTSRLTAAALRGLYDDLIKAESEAGDVQVNVDTDATTKNLRKRKLSNSDDGVDVNGEQLVPALVDKLYARFREKVVKEIREDEEEYAKLQAEIEDLEGQVETQRQAQQPAEPEPVVPSTIDDAGPSNTNNITKPVSPIQNSATQVPPASAPQVLTKPEVPPQQQPPETEPQSRPENIPQSALPIAMTSSVPRQASTTPRAISAHASPNLGQPGPQPSSPGAFHRTLPPPSPQGPGYGPLTVHHAYGSHGSPVPILPPPPGMPPVQASAQYTAPRPGQSRASPHLPPPQQYINYPQYPPPHQWQHQLPPQQFPQHGPYPYPPYHAPSPGPGNRASVAYQSPHQSPYQYTPTGPYQAQLPPVWQGPRGPPYPPPPHALSTTPASRPEFRQSWTASSNTSTPWKRTPRPANTLRPPSPTHREREISPLSDRDSPAPEVQRQKSPVVVIPARKEPDENTSIRRTTRRTRGASIGSSKVDDSRAGSVASDALTEAASTVRRAQKIKDEPTSTPAPMSDEAEASTRTSARRGRPRNSVVPSRTESMNPPPTTKRKRSSTRPGSPTPSLLPSFSSNARPTRQNSSLVAVSRNFAKTAHLLLNEITSHKLGGIFAKPLSERDAPGYKDLILRPQDLKSIKAAVSKGSRAATAAIEALEPDSTGPENVTDGTATPRGAPGGRGIFWVPKTEDLIPPKGIVNSSQLETELVRMFANAVMFNPLPTSERGFGTGLKLRSGKVLRTDDDEDGEERVGSEASSETMGDSSEEGIISDAREMFQDVMSMVAKWREVEDERVGAAGAGLATHATGVIRQGSVSVSEPRSRSSQVPEAEDADRSSVAATPTVEMSTGRGRKRRKIAE